MNSCDLLYTTTGRQHFTQSVKCRTFSSLCAVIMIFGVSRTHAQEQKRDQPPPSKGADIALAKGRLLKKVESLRWIAFSPSKFNPKSKAPLLRPDIQADLKTLVDAGFNGLVTYSCMPSKTDESSGAGDVVGFKDVPALARAAGFKGCVVGVWDPGSGTEIEAAVELAKKGLVDAVCVGNEGLDERYDWEKLKMAMADVRSRGAIPCTTTEQIEDYSLDGLRDPTAVDLLFPNVHPVFHNTEDPEKAAEWTGFMVSELRQMDKDRHDRLPILLKETGWPSRGMPYHTEQNQQKFWRAFDLLAKKAKIPYVMFESFDQPWKEELVLGENVGQHWGLFTTDRKPKLVVSRAAAELPKKKP